jgi:hypothetical protein
MISPTAHDEFEKDDFRVDDSKEEVEADGQKSYDDRQRKKKKNKRCLHLFLLRIDVNVFLHHI